MALTILVGLLLLAVAGIPTLVWMLLLKKNAEMHRGQIIRWGPRYRDGGVIYSQYRGIRSNMVVDNPNEQHNARYGRRHHNKQHSQTKPWMK